MDVLILIGALCFVLGVFGIFCFVLLARALKFGRKKYEAFWAWRVFGCSSPSPADVGRKLLAIDQELAERYAAKERCGCVGMETTCWSFIQAQRRTRDETFAFAFQLGFGEQVESRIRAGLPKPVVKGGGRMKKLVP